MITFEQFASHLARAAAAAPEAIADVVAIVTNRAEIRARGYIGEYQSGLGVLPYGSVWQAGGSWPQLSQATLQGFRHHLGFWIMGKIDLGYSPPDRPLERTGELADSIQGLATGNTGIIGSPLKKALWQEIGTPMADYPIPPRSFLGRAVMEAVPDIETLCGQAAVELLVPRGAAR